MERAPLLPSAAGILGRVLYLQRTAAGAEESALWGAPVKMGNAAGVGALGDCL